MAPGARIEQKTDNMHFFEFSIEQFSAAGFILKNISLDLHNSGFEDNIVTEYESRFIAEGLPIYRLEAYL
jgi:tRNA (guanine-N7-)-methyltransferase